MASEECSVIYFSNMSPTCWLRTDNKQPLIRQAHPAAVPRALDAGHAAELLYLAVLAQRT